MRSIVIFQFLALLTNGDCAGNLRALKLHSSGVIDRRTEALVRNAEVATYISESKPSKIFNSRDRLEVDGSPKEKHIYLQFKGGSFTNVIKVELRLQCINDSDHGGEVYGSLKAVNPDVTWESRHPTNDLTEKVGNLGKVEKGETILADISGVINDGRIEDVLNLVILPLSKDGADFTKDVKLIITLNDDGPGTTTTSSTITTAPETTTSSTRAIKPNQSNTDPFQLMLYWDKSYNWQETRDRRRWCVTCGKKGSECDNGDQVQIVECDDDSKRQWWVRDGKRFKSFTNKKLCWDYSDKLDFQLRKCSSSKNQEYDAVSVFNTEGTDFEYSFELFLPNKPGNCVTQKHHPKKKENLIGQPCDRAQKHDTSLWVGVAPPNLDGHRL